ncbi:VOC family protein [Pararhodobacter zhoushanensis]|uniref:VOC family protein n=1 Tax=Pararhodobacter zhoushanensis TaxID=2479545 RepID=A0ABT3GXJ6_9RHOB|nr:VOC family protein [Pararhodobacter zhoushanensis]MCW1932285.1 VOC family protein [Pararhodobacter zhoushanensis]
MLHAATRSPGFDITRLSHVVLTTIDLDRSRHFYETGLGLEVTHADADILCLRALEETSHHSLVIERATGPGTCRRLGFHMFDDDDLRAAHDIFAAQGLDPAFVERPFQGLTLRVTDPLGVPLEFCARMDQTTSRMQAFHTHQGGRLSYLDHVQVPIDDVDAVWKFWAGMGFRLTEYTAEDGTDEVWGIWLKRKNNTQDIVFANGPGPRLHHFAYHTPEIANVIHALDVMASLGLTGSMDRSPGRHGIGNAFFAYLRDPDGHRVEIFTSHYAMIDIDQAPKRWDLSDTSRSQLWGIPAPKRWFTEASLFEGVPPRAPLRNAPPVTLEDWLAAQASLQTKA